MLKIQQIQNWTGNSSCVKCKSTLNDLKKRHTQFNKVGFRVTQKVIDKKSLKRILDNLDHWIWTKAH